MNIFRDISEISKDENTFITLGTFDGIHLGHQKIIGRLIEKTKSANGRSFLVTFDPHPRNVISNNSDFKILSTPSEKAVVLEKLGIQNLLIINFTKEFSQNTAEDFFKNYIIDSIGIREIVIGYDHHFGKGRGGDETTLRDMGRQYGFNVETVDAFRLDGEIISSTKIRKALAAGDIRSAAMSLGRNYEFSGKVIEGDKRGRDLGFPTANIELDNDAKLLPAIGIYVVEVFVGNSHHFGLLSIGKRPTFYNSGKIISEVYIYDFDKEIYGRDIKIIIIERLRGEEKFSSADELVDQMNIDKKNGFEIIRNLEPVNKS
ncbi:MAG TPA: bifunctional riboflavin kinase/FAD synthetase [Ignavibacteriaceae bacterium]|nr:bifunctional riboflavin kinase/FAD synthetase [Ignavibacteriaceae bacterium]